MKTLDKRKSGFALIYALGLVVLVAGLIAAFLLSSRTERSVASGFAASTAARQLANTAVGLVQAQINEATSLGTSYAWVSQPGMIRVFNAAGPFQTYKLYSAGEMVLAGPPKFQKAGVSADLPDKEAWKSSPATWVDLNAPVRKDDPSTNDPTKPSGTLIYPIVDDAALRPILNSGVTIGGLEDIGFKIDKNEVPGATTNQPVPMPVRWLYVLRNGEVVLPGGNGKNATVPGATDTGNEATSNPIVGRIAFWADDDTCKVNVNTAGSGVVKSTDSSARSNADTFWDVPRASSKSELAFAKLSSNATSYGPPKNKEYQRFPGHPGTVALSAVLPNLKGADYIEIAPRYNQDGDSVKGDRLYASLDELVFNTKLNGEKRADAILAEDVLKSRRFFLTAHSQGPETTLFNTPRVAMWPIYKGQPPDLNTDKTTAFDRLIAFCASLRTKDKLEPYYFQRELNMDPTNDFKNIQRNRDLYAYLQYLTGRPIPGYGTGSFLTKYPSPGGSSPSDRDQILTEIFDYIRSTNLYDATLPERNQFTQKYVIDSATDSTGHGYVVPIKIGDTQGFGRYLTLSEFSLLFICSAAADNDPATAFDESLSNVPLLNKMLTQADPPLVLPTDPPGTQAQLKPGERLLQVAVLLELSGVSQGWTIIRPLETVQIDGLQNLSVTTAGGKSFLNLPKISEADPRRSAKYTFGDRARWQTSWDKSLTGENPGFKTLLYEKRAPWDAGAAVASRNIYPLIGKPFKIIMPSSGEMMSLGTTTLTLKIFNGPEAVGDPIQTILLEIPPMDIPIPKLAATGTQAGDSEPRDWWSISRDGADAIASETSPPSHPWGRLRFATFDPGTVGAWKNGALIREEFDTLVSWLPRHGDYRLIAGSGNITQAPSGRYVFEPHPYVGQAGVRIFSNLSQFDKMSSPGYVFGGTYVDGLSFNLNRAAPDIPPQNPSGLPDARPYVSRDFDNGIANSIDGPYINKPDEGSLSGGNDEGYFKRETGDDIGGATYFSPNRIMPSPGMLGSLPTGVIAQEPWQTLLFRPQPSHPQSTTSRPGLPADYLIMDLFWMPVVEPYAISDRLSTAGKINMNYQIMPFTYIERSTGMRAVLQPEKLTSIPDGDTTTYKTFEPSTNSSNYRHPLNLQETLSQFTDVFNNGQVFKSPAEICDIYMVPDQSTLSDVRKPTGYWNQHRLTGDNTREHIYATIYPKLTTKSNTYTVHFRAQSLKKIKGTAATEWVEDRDIVTGEYRGSTTIERFINPDPRRDPSKPDEDVFPPDYAANPSGIPGAKTLDSFYKWRVVENRQFAP